MTQLTFRVTPAGDYVPVLQDTSASIKGGNPAALKINASAGPQKSDNKVIHVPEYTISWLEFQIYQLVLTSLCHTPGCRSG